MRLRIGKGVDRACVRKAFLKGSPDIFTYKGILDEDDIRETIAGIREAGTPPEARALLTWLASHPNTPEEALRELAANGEREVLQSLCLNHKLPEDVRSLLLHHPDDQVRAQANRVEMKRGRGAR